LGEGQVAVHLVVVSAGVSGLLRGLNLEDACVFGAGKASLKPGQPLRKPDNLFMRADPSEAPPV
jgi:hypothetical protein